MTVESISSASTFFIGFLVALVLFGVLYICFGRRSRDYRKTLADLYVAAKIRFLAKEDGLDLNEENENLKKWNKKRRMETQQLDVTIEEELQDRITEKAKEKKK